MLFIAADITLSQVRRQLARFGVDAQRYEMDGPLAFIECRSSGSAKGKDAVFPRSCDMADLDGLVSAVDDTLSDSSDSFSRVIFYSITPFFMYHDADSLSMFLERLSLKAKQYGSLTTVIHKGVLSDDQVLKAETTVDGVIDVRVDDAFRRYVRIRRMNGLTVKPSWVPLEVVRGAETGSSAFLAWRKDAPGGSGDD